MKKKRMLAVLMVLVMLFTLAPTTTIAATKQPVDETYMMALEEYYIYYIKDRSKYCDDVWTEIQQAYQEGRAYGLAEDEYGLTECLVALENLGSLTWVKGYQDLDEVKSRYLKAIDDEYKNHRKSDYNEYNWDFIEDGLYVGKKRINEATTFREACSGYDEAMTAMYWATTKAELKYIKDEYKDELSRVVYLYIDAKEYSEPLWNEIEKLYEEAIAVIDKAEQENELETLYLTYLEKICTLAKLTYPLDYEEIEAILEEIIRPVYEFFETMTEADYTEERLWEADDLVWMLEENLYFVKDRVTAEKKVAKTLEKLEAIPTRAEDEKFYKEYVLKAKAVGKTGTSIKVSWNADINLDGYIIYRASSKNGTYKKIKHIENGKTSSYTDKKVTYGKNYYYKVKGIKTMDYVDKYTKVSNIVKATPKLVKPVVTLKKVNKQDVKVSWKQVTGADGYQIYRSTSVNGQFKLVKTVKKGDTLSWTDTSTVKGKNYCYKVRAYDVKKDNSKKYSAYSTIKSIKR